MLLLLLIICIILTILSRIDLLYNTKALSLDEIYDLADTGDIINYRWRHIWFGQDLISPFTHTGLVIVHPTNKQKFVVETHVAGDTENIGVYTGGIHVYPLKLRLRTYDGTAFLVKLKQKPDNIDVMAFLTQLNEYRETIPFYKKYLQYFIKNCVKERVFPGSFNIEDKEGMFCSEFVGFSLKELNIIPKSVKHECLTPSDFRYIKDERGEYLYKDLIRIKISS